MNEFVLLFRHPNFEHRNDPEKLKEISKKWQDWIGGIAAQGRLASNGMRLDHDGSVLRPGGVITDGPFVEIKEKLGGFFIVRAESKDDALTLAHGCPALELGGSVEIRRILQ